MSDAPRTLALAFTHRIGALTLDIRFSLDKPWTVVFAPSGAGKSTVLRVIAGLIRPDSGRVALPGLVLTDTKANVFVPPHLRGIRFVGQQAALFPHLSVLENIAYGATPGDAMTDILRLCRVEHLVKKMPSQISGGERQRVALARALASGPSNALLLDEPFSGLDAGLRDEITTELKEWLKAGNLPVLQVTHDVGEVFAVASEVIRLEDGRVLAQGPPEIVLRLERKRLFDQIRG